LYLVLKKNGLVMASQAELCPITVRPAHLSDALALQQTCWPNRLLTSIVDLLERAEKLEQHRRGLGVVGVLNGRVCAYGMLTLWPRAAEISDLIVSAADRDQGIGSQIITYLTEMAHGWRVQMLEIGVALSNPRALALYRRLGFMDHHTVQIDLGCGIEAVLYLNKTLSGY
jgi:ribosomal protein S18 acetylase RimI-like enzyme